ncbi:MAG: hypothetical protein EA350_16525 [Gemmatimonadales bacterium]|nr:MAG: hypothetical protein EA350_16525 [Gemmatimonadales bacterium]
MPDLLPARLGPALRQERFLARFRSLDLERAVQCMDTAELEVIRGALGFLLDELLPFQGPAASALGPGGCGAEGVSPKDAFLEEEIDHLGRELLAWFAAPGAPAAVRDARCRAVLRSVHRIEAVLDLHAPCRGDQEAN